MTEIINKIIEEMEEFEKARRGNKYGYRYR
jgi:hypothetical protein